MSERTDYRYGADNKVALPLFYALIGASMALAVAYAWTVWAS